MPFTIKFKPITIATNKYSYFFYLTAFSHAFAHIGRKVISLNALNIFFATNSSAIYRQPSEDIKPFVIPVDFFTEEEIIKSIKMN